MDKPSTKIKERPLIFVDLEFTGLEFQHEIIQIGAVVVSQPASTSPLVGRGGPNFQIIKEWEVKVKAQHMEKADPEALKIVGYTDEKWKNAIDIRSALEKFNEIAKDGVIIGWNIAMDFLFLKKTYAQLDLKPTFHWQIIDVMSMAFLKLYKEPLTEFRMSEITKYFDIKNDKHHDALADAIMTFEIYLKLCQISQ